MEHKSEDSPLPHQHRQQLPPLYAAAAASTPPLYTAASLGMYPPPPPAAIPAYSHSASMASFAPMPASVPSGGHTLLRGNLSLQERVALSNLQAHHANLRRAVATVGSRRGRGVEHSTLARNHEAAVARNAEQKAAEIARQNTAMVQKITETVIKGKSPYRVDVAAKPYTHTSLNLARRKKEQARIATANLQLAKRIIEKKAEIGAKSEWSKHAQRHDRILAQVSRYVDATPAIAAQQQHQLQMQQHYQMQLQMQQLQIANAQAAHAQQFAPQQLPPGFTPESYAEALALQQLAWQQQQQQLAAGGGYFAPASPSYPRGTSPAVGTGPLRPIPDADQREARLTQRLIQQEKERFGPASQSHAPLALESDDSVAPIDGPG